MEDENTITTSSAVFYTNKTFIEVDAPVWIFNILIFLGYAKITERLVKI